MPTYLVNSRNKISGETGTCLMIYNLTSGYNYRMSVFYFLYYKLIIGIGLILSNSEFIQLRLFTTYEPPCNECEKIG